MTGGALGGVLRRDRKVGGKVVEVVEAREGRSCPAQSAHGRPGAHPCTGFGARQHDAIAVTRRGDRSRTKLHGKLGRERIC